MADARCSLLPPRDHAFWRDPQAVEHAIAATVAVEQERVQAVTAAEEATRRAADSSLALSRSQAETKALREQLAAAVRSRATPGGGAAKPGAVHEAPLLAQVQTQLQSCLAAQAAATAEAATLRAALEVERTRARDAARAATVAAAATAVATAGRPEGMDTLRLELVEERMRVRELSSQLAEVQAELPRVRQTLRSTQAALDEARSRVCELQAKLSARDGTPSPPSGSAWQQHRTN
jgi:hypothetical protein